MKVPISEQELGVVEKSSYDDSHWFTPRWEPNFDRSIKRGAAILTFAQFKERYPYERGHIFRRSRHRKQKRW